MSFTWSSKDREVKSASASPRKVMARNPALSLLARVRANLEADGG
jgi:hypothetical protein